MTPAAGVPAPCRRCVFDDLDGYDSRTGTGHADTGRGPVTAFRIPPYPEALMSDYDPGDVVLNRLAEQFPAVPKRIIADVLDAYCREDGRTLPDAAFATRARLLDACAP